MTDDSYRRDPAFQEFYAGVLRTEAAARRARGGPADGGFADSLDSWAAGAEARAIELRKPDFGPLFAGLT